ncbi:MAG: hypothetical protein A2X49_04380 [Lentisphaerae bacterium GWF2_52_8]|nr:MAG: hypothetical protein A2X49_04380 [Lentisphaerae bacterium GWF2_52_8]
MDSNSNAIEKDKVPHTHHGKRCACGHSHVSQGPGHSRSMARLSVALIGAYFIANSYLLHWLFPAQVFAAELSAVIGALVLALPIIIEALRDLYEGVVHMNELVALAILAALAGSDFRTAGIIAFFLLLTIIIETRTASGAQRSIEELIKLTPNTARKLVNGAEIEVNALELAVGDMIRIRPGENFPVDARIARGQSAVNQASITGESLPVDKNEGDDVFAGTQNLSGSLDVCVSKLGADTTLGKVKEMILAAEQSKSPIVRTIDRYAGYYTPTILMLAGLTWWFSGGDMYRVITLLVISCPCAVVLATPSAVIAAVAAAARLGILVKNVSHFELAAKIREFVFDKTGTLTEGVLSVARLSPEPGIEPAELLLLAASAESHSNHPTARALQKLAEEAGLSLKEPSEFSETHGKGVRAIIEGQECLVGRASWINAKEKNGNEEAGMSIVHVSKNGRLMGWIGFKDKVRADAAQIISELKDLGIKRCAMVTGDRDSVASVVAETLKMDDFRSECLPEAKVAYVAEAKRSAPIAVVGDGVNDAPALAEGDLGIAMGAIGSDIAINSASIALMTNDLRRIPVLISLSRKLSLIVNQNLFLGLFFILGGIMLSVFGKMTPIWAALLHTTSTLIILFNSARLVRTGEELMLEGIPGATPKSKES